MKANETYGGIWEVHGSAKQPYRVDPYWNNIGSCSCPAWRNAKNQDGVKPACKHITYVRSYMDNGIPPDKAQKMKKSLIEMMNE